MPKPYFPSYGSFTMDELNPGAVQQAGIQPSMMSEPVELGSLAAPANRGSNITGQGPGFSQFLGANVGRTMPWTASRTDPSENIPGIFDKNPGISGGEAALDAQLASVLSPISFSRKQASPELQGAKSWENQQVAPVTGIAPGTSGEVFKNAITPEQQAMDQWSSGVPGATPLFDTRNMMRSGFGR